MGLWDTTFSHSINEIKCINISQLPMDRSAEASRESKTTERIDKAFVQEPASTASCADCRPFYTRWRHQYFSLMEKTGW